jgi:GNAT superfamily N-acetyltransferase
MLSISVARSRDDFEGAEGLCRKLGEWDAAIAPDHGLTPAQVLAAFHSESFASLSEKFSSADAKFLIARWEDMPAGSLAFDAFDETCAELHRFYVDDQFRGMGIGRKLMQAVLAEIARGSRRRVLIHTTPYMTHAIAIYEAFGFRPCARFRDTPEHIRHTDLFMDKSI